MDKIRRYMNVDIQGDCQIICVNGHSRKLKCFLQSSFYGGNYGDTTRVIGRVVKGL